MFTQAAVTNQSSAGFVLGEKTGMKLAGITGQGLRWIGGGVLILWACVVVENSMVAHARRDAVNTLVELQRMREGQRPVPAAAHPLKPSWDASPRIG